EVNSGDGLSRRDGSRLKGESVSRGQSAGAAAVGRGHSRAPDVHRTRPTHSHVPLAQTGLGFAAGR
ncbi:hypothetical protein M9458_016797, partial [Cirrhinus mrigala]